MSGPWSEKKRSLAAVWPIVYLDAMVIRVRESGSVRRKSAYLPIGIGVAGQKEVLGLWLEETEGAKFWLSVLTELKNRGVADVLIACVDGLEGFPQTTVQICIVHTIQNLTRYVSRKDRKQVVRDLKPAYTAVDRQK